jgi:hypothetical protein
MGDFVIVFPLRVVITGPSGEAASMAGESLYSCGGDAKPKSARAVPHETPQNGIGWAALAINWVVFVNEKAAEEEPCDSSIPTVSFRSVPPWCMAARCSRRW